MPANVVKISATIRASTFEKLQDLEKHLGLSRDAIIDRLIIGAADAIGARDTTDRLTPSKP